MQREKRQGNIFSEAGGGIVSYAVRRPLSGRAVLTKDLPADM